jgi:transcriptional regulator with XRE-family HTH domain
MINEKIKLRRIQQKLTQQELSDKSGVSQQLISKIENGKAQPSLRTITKLANVLKLDIDLKVKD